MDRPSIRHSQAYRTAVMPVQRERAADNNAVAAIELTLRLSAMAFALVEGAESCRPGIPQFAKVIYVREPQTIG
jgi:hypothetical protein